MVGLVSHAAIGRLGELDEIFGQEATATLHSKKVHIFLIASPLSQVSTHYL